MINETCFIKIIISAIVFSLQKNRQAMLTLPEA